MGSIVCRSNDERGSLLVYVTFILDNLLHQTGEFRFQTKLRAREYCELTAVSYLLRILIKTFRVGNNLLSR